MSVIAHCHIHSTGGQSIVHGATWLAGDRPPCASCVLAPRMHSLTHAMSPREHANGPLAYIWPKPGPTGARRVASSLACAAGLKHGWCWGREALHRHACQVDVPQKRHEMSQEGTRVGQSCGPHRLTGSRLWCTALHRCCRMHLGGNGTFMIITTVLKPTRHKRVGLLQANGAL